MDRESLRKIELDRTKEEIAIERALRKIEMEKALKKSESDESDFREIVKISRKEGDEELEEINENGIDKEREEMERALEKIDDSVYYKIVKLIIRKDHLCKASSENDFELIHKIILEEQKFMKENGIKKDVFDYLLKKMQGYLWYSGYV